MATDKPDARLAAVNALREVLIDGHALGPPAIEDPRDAALAQAIAYGVLRQLPVLQARLDGYLRKPLKAREHNVRLVALCGLYQLGWMRLPAYAAIDATVEVCRALGRHWATGLVNGILRSYQRDGCPTGPPPGAAAHVAAAHPLWLYQRLSEAWPDQLDAIVQANNTAAPMWLRVNGDASAYVERLSQQQMASGLSVHAESAVCLEQAIDVQALPGFSEGEVSVQDAAAQLAAGLLAASEGHRVLDACAAPGGKTAHLLERTAGLDLTALDISGERNRRVTDNLTRLHLSARVITADALGSADWWDGRPFDRILLDAPCSGSGVIRRHPDIKVLRQQSDLVSLSKTQTDLLTTLWPLLAPGGCLLYVTCSVLPAENDAVVGAFLEQTSDARATAIQAEWGRATAHGRQILPGEDGMDGFYYAVLENASNGP